MMMIIIAATVVTVAVTTISIVLEKTCRTSGFAGAQAGASFSSNKARGLKELLSLGLEACRDFGTSCNVKLQAKARLICNDHQQIAALKSRNQISGPTV